MTMWVKSINHQLYGDNF